MRSPIDPQPAKDLPTGVKIFPPDMVRRRIATWKGIQAESLEIMRLEQFESSQVGKKRRLPIISKSTSARTSRCGKSQPRQCWKAQRGR
jgi:hypothetical protein